MHRFNITNLILKLFIVLLNIQNFQGVFYDLSCFLFKYFLYKQVRLVQIQISLGYINLSFI